MSKASAGRPLSYPGNLILVNSASEIRATAFRAILALGVSSTCL